MTANIISSLAHDHSNHLSHHQRSILSKICAILEARVQAGDFTAWSISADGLCLSGFYADEAPAETGPHPIFDLGSLTKPLLAGLLFVLASPDEWVQYLQEAPPLGRTLPQDVRDKLETMQIRYLDLFAHQSGLPHWQWFGRGLFSANGNKRLATINGDGHCGLTPDRMNAFVHHLLRAMLSEHHGKAVQYSDCGYFLLSRLLESDHRVMPGGCWRMALQSLNETLGTHFFHSSLTPALPRTAVPYFPYLLSEREYIGTALSAGKQFGSVHDTNANILASLNPESPLISSHAGLFGNVTDVLAAAQRLNVAWARHEAELISLSAGNDRFCAFLDTATGEHPLSSASASFRAHVFGHLGYTGTSFWFRTKPSQNCCVLLTNRTARRTVMRAEEAPRVFSLTTPASPASLHALQVHGRSSPLGVDDFTAIRETYHSAVERHWNSSDCRPTPDLALTRRETGRLLWKLCT